MSLEFKLIVAALFAVITGFFVWRYEDAISTAQKAVAASERDAQALAEQATSLQVLKSKLEVYDALVREKQFYDDGVRKKLAQFGSKLDSIASSNAEVRTWRDTSIPTAIRDIMRTDTGTGGAHSGIRPPTTGVDSTYTLPNSGLLGATDKWRASELRKGLQSSAGDVQR